MNESEKDIAESILQVKITLTEKQSQRFWAKVNKDGPIHATKPELGKCWLWTAGKWARGYGAFWLNGGQIKTHRLSYLMEIGDIPVATPFVLHSCDVRLCCNPSHLFLGTYATNCADMCSKGRYKPNFLPGGENYFRVHPEKVRRGSQLKHAKLTEDEVRKIRNTVFDKSNTQVALAKELNVTTGSISMILSRKTWKHVI